jgi:hypothetical protein
LAVIEIISMAKIVFRTKHQKYWFGLFTLCQCIHTPLVYTEPPGQDILPGAILSISVVLSMSLIGFRFGHALARHKEELYAWMALSGLLHFFVTTDWSAVFVFCYFCVRIAYDAHLAQTDQDQIGCALSLYTDWCFSVTMHFFLEVLHWWKKSF